jgi:hypothetical protein
MSVTQTILIKDTSGTTYADAEVLVAKLGTDVPTLAATESFILTAISDGALVTESSAVVFPGNSITITRVWADDKWAEFLAFGGVSESTFETAGWSITSSDNS